MSNSPAPGYVDRSSPVARSMSGERYPRRFAALLGLLPPGPVEDSAEDSHQNLFAAISNRPEASARNRVPELEDRRRPATPGRLYSLPAVKEDNRRHDLEAIAVETGLITLGIIWFVHSASARSAISRASCSSDWRGRSPQKRRKTR